MKTKIDRVNQTNCINNINCIDYNVDQYFTGINAKVNKEIYRNSNVWKITDEQTLIHTTFTFYVENVYRGQIWPNNGCYARDH